MRKLKNIILTLIIAVFMLGILGTLNKVNAESAGPIYLGIISLRSSGRSYMQSEKKVWKIAKYESQTDTTADTSDLIYCIKAGAGFGSQDSTTEIKAYNQSFKLKEKDSISSPYVEVLPTGENYNKLIWLLDHMYTKIGENNETDRNTYLNSVIPTESGYSLLTDDDIDVIQQLAIWYFTNPTGDYHYDNIELYMNSIEGTDADYKTLEDLFGDDGWDRQDAAKALYNYYITSADGTYTAINNTTTPISLDKTNATMQTIGSDYVAGPYRINQILNIEYNLTAIYKNYGTQDTITPTLGIKNESGNIVSTSKSLKELVGQEFYLIMPVSSGIQGIDITINTSYTNRDMTYWSVENAPSIEQPVVIVKDRPYNFSESASLVVVEEKVFDLALRKFITNINGAEITNRIPVPEVSELTAGTARTATYTHTKEPLKVSIGDIITYTIRVYNEGEVDGYVTEITDHLPEQLEYIVDDELNIKYGWAYTSNTDLRTMKTSYLSADNEKTSGENKIKAFDGTTLQYKEVQIKCRVVSTENMAEKITNIAEITGFTDGEGKAITDRDSQAKNVDLPTGADLQEYKDQEIARGEEYIEGQQDDDDFEKVMLKEFDLALRKFITKVNDTEITNRVPSPDIKALKAGTAKTATYNHYKSPVKVDIGDTIVYTIRIYNEGEVDGYANEITDHLPDQLEFLPDHETNKQYGWVADEENSKIVRSNYLSKANGTENLIAAFDGTTLQYKELKIACKVKQTDPMVEKITNIADITDFVNSNGENVTDRDSQKDNVNIPENWPSYKDNEIAKDYVPGQEDDDDFEKVMLKEFDLALRKFITKINGKNIETRIPEVDTTALKAGTAKTATYIHSKESLNVAVDNVVEYTIRIYNEGEVDGYANEITDYLPEQLEFLPEDETNKKYGWTADEENSKIIRTSYLSQENEENKINAFDGEKLSYKDVKIVCKVIETSPMVSKITNIAEISDFVNGNGEKVTDRDSQEKNVEIPSNLPEYKEDEIGKDYVPGQQDDDDFEKVELKEFDLALRKFITAVNNTEITTREPEFSIDEDGNYVYTHTKEPVLVTNSNIVTYTMRVYNEGEINGYANLIKDDIPEGLEFLPENELNTEYRWKMLDNNDEETEDVSKAKSIVTDYLSMEQEKTEKENLLLAFKAETMEEPDYKEVKVAFKVIESNKSDKIIINQAQIAEHKDENGFDIKDKDSKPNEWNEGEDDQDIEKIKVQYFDLALRKWVTQAIVIENGQETITETGHKAEDDPEGIVKVDLKKKNINSVVVKFNYSIRVTNEGQIAGYVKEIKDYIPEGLKFVAEDNPQWTEIESGVITTDQAKDTLLEPGESTEVKVLLTWINDENNMGLKVNVAEISKDYNEFNAPDIDSTPDNKKDGEDDIDDAPVMISVATGEVKKYILISGSVLIILASGIVLIKKYVI